MDRRDVCALGAERLEVEGSQLMGARIALGLANVDGCLGLEGHEQLGRGPDPDV